jgi:hypothetical protein
MDFQNREVRASVERINGQELQVSSSSELLANDMVEARFEAPGLASGINVWIHIKNRVLEPGETLRYIAHIVRMEDSEREVLDNWLKAQAAAAPSKPRAEFKTPSEQVLPPQNVKPSGTPSYLDAMRKRRKARGPVTPNRTTPAVRAPSAPPAEKEDFFPPPPPAARTPSTPPSPRPTPPIQIPVPDFFPSAPKAAEPAPPPAANEDFFPPPPPAALQRKQEAPAPVASPEPAQPAMPSIPEGATPSFVLENGNLTLNWDNPDTLRLAFPALLEGFFIIPEQAEPILGLRFLLPNGSRLALRIKSQSHENGQTTLYFRINQVLAEKLKSACD